MTTTVQFLRALYPDPVHPGKLLEWTSTRRKGIPHCYWLSTLGEVAEHAHRVKQTRDVCFGVVLHDPVAARDVVRRRFPRARLPSVRACHDSAVALPALWAELDFAGESPGEAAILMRLAATSPPPPIVVATAGGFQAYWPLHELWILEDDAARARAASLQRRLQAAVAAAAGCREPAPGETAGLARLLPLPGTLDHTRSPARPVEVVHFPLDPSDPGTRFGPDDFEHLPALAERAAGPRQAGGATPARFEPMFAGCRFLQHCYREQDRLGEDEWLAALGLVGRSASRERDAEALAHDFSRGHPGYRPLRTLEMLEHALRDLEAADCVEIEERFDLEGRLCGRCPHRGRIQVPLDLGRGPDEAASPPAWGPAAPAAPGAVSAAGEPAQIVVTPREHEVNDQALAALAAREPDLFERGGRLVHVARPGTPDRGTPERGPVIARPIQEARMAELLARHCAFVKPVKVRERFRLRPVHPPRWCARALLARGAWPELPLLAGVVECPVLRADGSVLQTPGHDPRSGLFYQPSGDFGPVAEQPTKHQSRRALDRLREAVADFPFRAESHFAAWLASLLTPLARAAFRGPAPLGLIDANVSGAGKSLLADVASTLLTGRPAARMSYTGNEDELRKAITAIAIEGTRLALIDNVSGSLGSPTLDRALTAETWRDRLLGGNEQVSVPLEVTWLATGNNLRLTGDTPRRCLYVRLESTLERPERRRDFRHPRLLEWLRRRRPRLLPAALTLLRAYVAAGRPDLGLPAWGSYEGWSDLVRSAVVALGLPDPAETRDELAAAAGGRRAEGDLIDGLAEVLEPLGGAATAREILARLARAGDAYPRLRSALEDAFPRLPGGKLPSPTQLGGRLRSCRGRVVRGAFVDQASKGYRGASWTVRRVA